VAARPLLAVTLMVTMAHGTRAPLRGDHPIWLQSSEVES
jgi:hypothetical protein